MIVHYESFYILPSSAKQCEFILSVYFDDWLMKQFHFFNHMLSIDTAVDVHCNDLQLVIILLPGIKF